MRATIDRRAGWQNWWDMRRPVRVLLDDVEIRRVVEADEEAGTVLAYNADRRFQSVYLGRVQIIEAPE